jgi:APA family basic amino acid/polyamine antiporter
MSKLPRTLSLLDSTMINVGTMIGSGVFLVPSSVALYLMAPEPILLVWVLGGVVSVLGALAMAELGAAMPEAGGQVVYLAEAYSPIFGFLYGWTAFTFINPASIAALAVALVSYLGFFMTFDPVTAKFVAIGSIALLTGVNCFGVRVGATMQNVLTMLKVLLLLALVVAGFTLPSTAPDVVAAVMPEGSFAGRFALAMVICLWAYDGWMEVTYVGGEVRDPGRNIPRSIMLSLVIVIGVYLLVNAALMAVLGVAGMAASTAVASDAAVATMGAIGAAFVAIGVMVSTMGSNNGIIFTTARAPYALAQRGYFMKWAGAIHPRFKTPVVAMVLQGSWASIMALTGTFNQLATYVVFASFVFYGMSAAGVIVLRRRKPAMPRPYKTWGYPITPILFVGFSLWLVGSTIVAAPVDAAIGLGMIGLGVPVFLYWKGRGEGRREY